MSNPVTIDKAHTALLVLDCQNQMIANNTKNDPGFLERASAMLAAAREAGLRIIYVVTQFRKGYPEANPHNRMLEAVRAAGMLQEGSQGVEIHPAFTPRDGDVIVTKRRVNAFVTTDLESILRGNAIDSLILMGVATSGVVLSTVRWAADADYDLSVVADCCADNDAEVHNVLTRKVFPRQARVIESPELIAALAHV